MEIPNASSVNPELGSIVGVSAWAEQIRAAIPRLALLSTPVTIFGHAGTGKESIARTIHALSRRSQSRYLAVDCVGLQGEAAQQCMFGRAAEVSPAGGCPETGCFLAARGGTIYLDEIAALDLTAQSGVLEALRHGTVSPRGSLAPMATDVRIIAGTSRDLEQEVAAGRFLGELCDGLRGEVLSTLPLADRPEDIAALANHFLAEFAALYQVPRKRLSPQAVAELARYDWPGNLDELHSVIERAIMTTEGGAITPQSLCLPEVVAEPTILSPFSTEEDSTGPTDLVEPGWPTMAEVEREHFRRTLERTGNDERAAARLLDMNWHQFQHRLEQYGLASWPKRPGCLPNYGAVRRRAA